MSDDDPTIEVRELVLSDLIELAMLLEIPPAELFEPRELLRAELAQLYDRAPPPVRDAALSILLAVAKKRSKGETNTRPR